MELPFVHPSQLNSCIDFSLCPVLSPHFRTGFSSLASAFSLTLDAWTSGSAIQRYETLSAATACDLFILCKKANIHLSHPVASTLPLSSSIHRLLVDGYTVVSNPACCHPPPPWFRLPPIFHHRRLRTFFLSLELSPLLVSDPPALFPLLCAVPLLSEHTALLR